MRQDKGRAIIILDCKSYIEKCLDVLNTKQIHKIQYDPTNTLESKMQQILRKFKCHLD